MNTSLKKERGQEYFASEIGKGKKDMQGLISRGYDSLNSACYLLLRITDPNLAKLYFNELIENYITSADTKNRKDLTDNGDPKTAVHIAFTSSGLKALGLNVDSFSREFKEGMTHVYPDKNNKNKKISERSNLLGDTRKNSPERWHWGSDTEEGRVDGVLMLYARNNDDLRKLIGVVYTKLQKGLASVQKLETYEYGKFSKEHFGFDDGISQPIMKGFSKAGSSATRKLINPGEFILGYLNEYNNYAPSPYVDVCPKSASLDFLPGFSDKKDLGKNGTYLVFRQIEQHVELFWSHLYKVSKETGAGKIAKAITLGAKMVGRWPDGRPLVICPTGNGQMDRDLQNIFTYAQQDKDGVHCPFGAHIRRTNPRDQAHTGRGPKDSLDMSTRHRMLRRGRIYGEPLDKNFDIENMIWQVKGHDSTEKLDAQGKTQIRRGIHFICLVSDIGRQFEFVQNVWANTSTFGDLCNEVDPMISPRPTDGQPHCHEFTTPQDTIRNRYTNVPEFTTVVGGAYFFMPGIEALKYIMSMTV